jgi:hypothetical protein
MQLLDSAQKRFGTVGLVAASVAAASISAIYVYHLHLSIQRKGEAPIIWSWLPVLGNAIDLGSRPLEFLSECSEEHPEVFGMVVAGNRMFVVADVFSCNLILKPPKCLTWEEFHHAVLTNFFGSSNCHPVIDGVGVDEHLMRKWYSNYLLRSDFLVQ